MALAILQARMSSSRLPGKVLAPLAGAPMILRQIERLRRTRTLERIVVARPCRRRRGIGMRILGSRPAIRLFASLSEFVCWLEE